MPLQNIKVFVHSHILLKLQSLFPNSVLVLLFIKKETILRIFITAFNKVIKF